jgi:hypothetical protein
MAEQQDSQSGSSQPDKPKTLIVEAGAADEIKVVKGGSNNPAPMKSVLFLALVALVAVVLFFGWSLFVRATTPTNRTNANNSVPTPPLSREVPLNDLGES